MPEVRGPVLHVLRLHGQAPAADRHFAGGAPKGIGYLREAVDEDALVLRAGLEAMMQLYSDQFLMIYVSTARPCSEPLPGWRAAGAVHFMLEFMLAMSINDLVKFTR